MMRLFRPLGGALLASALFFASPAHADDPRKAQADAIFEEGVKLHNADHEAEALEKFKKAYAIYPHPNTMMAQARAEQLSGRPVEAARHYREAVKSPLLHPKNLELAKGYLTELESKLGRLSITGPAGTTFSMFGETFKLPLDAPLDVEPGTIRLHGDHDGAGLDGAATVVAGKLVTLDFKGASGMTTGPKGPGPITEPPAEPGQSFWDTPRVVGLVAAGLGVGGIVAGVALGGSSRSAGDRANVLADQLGPSGCAGATAPSSCADLSNDRDTQRSNASLSTVFVVIGTVVGVGGAALFLWPRQDKVTVTPSVGKSSASLTLGGSF